MTMYSQNQDGNGGILITLEGIDGAGKSTSFSALKDELSHRDDVVFTREPTSSWYGDAVYKSLSDDDADPFAELFLYMADHSNHLTSTIYPAINDGKIVISDRYIDSRCAYQAVTLGEYMNAPMNYIKQIHKPFTVIPDYTILFDVDPEIAVERSSKANKFEQQSHLECVDQNYKQLARMEPNRFEKVDAEKSKADVIDSVLTLVDGIIRVR